MNDPTETARRILTNHINTNATEREALEAKHGQVWSTDELQLDFSVLSFAAPFVIVRRNSDGKMGTLTFQHSPRFYFNFTEDK